METRKNLINIFNLVMIVFISFVINEKWSNMLKDFFAKGSILHEWTLLHKGSFCTRIRNKMKDSINEYL